MSALTLAEDLCPVTTVLALGPRYTVSEIAEALPMAKPSQSRKLPIGGELPLELLPLVDDAVVSIAQAQPKLWSGEWEKIRGIGRRQIYPSQSEADMALASYISRHLADRGADQAMLHALTEAAFSQSALAERPKWQDREDYRLNTIGRACSSAVAPLAKGAAQPEKTTTVDWSGHGDVRNANCFADMWAGALAYVPQQQRWMRWENARWAMCLNGEEVERAKETCKAIYAAAGEKLAEDPERGQRLVREAVQAHNLPRINAMLALAQSDTKLLTPHSRLDADPYVIGVGNGVVDLRSGKLLPNKPGFFVTRYCSVDFDPVAACSGWLNFLDSVFQGDQATIDTLQVLLGYTLTGFSREEIMVFCVGFGANGKSLLGNVVSAIMGDYGKFAPSTLLAARRSDDHGPRSDLAMLDGARLVSINELPAGMQLDEPVVKQLAGREPISARFLHKEFFTYQPRFTPWVRTNHKPIVKGDDDGIWRRLVILPFRRTFAPHEQDPHLEAKLLGERDGILRWMIEGAQKYLKNGLKLSPAMRREQAQYRKDSDMLGEFLSERTQDQPGSRIEQGQCYLNWTIWCSTNGVQPGSKKTFTQRLSERGYGPTSSNGKRYYAGLALK